MGHLRQFTACALTACALCVAAFDAALAITPDDPGAGNVRFTINSGTGAKQISKYIYGVNFYGSSGITAPATLDRLGGNRWTGYNWENNFSNAGADFYHHNDRFLSSSTVPGQAVRPSLVSAAANNRGLVVTVPMAGYVAADDLGTVDETEVAPSPRWKEVVAKKSMIYPGQPLSLAPDTADGVVFTDEFANWVESTKTPNQQVFYSLDNEPGIWGAPIPAGWQSGNGDSNPRIAPTSRIATHPLIHPSKATYTEMRDKTIAHAGAIKDVNPNAVVFGGVSYGWAEFNSLQNATEPVPNLHHPGGDSNGELNYLEYLLNSVRVEEQTQGRKLMDVLDIHWYPEAQGGGVRISDENSSNPTAAVIQARVQAPRSLWDATYKETSWITGCCTGGGPIKLLKHIERDIADFNPGTKMAVTEYNYGGGQHISGGIAEADVLGIFGTEGVYAANLWPLSTSQNNNRFTSGAMKMYLNYDNAGGQFGDTSVTALTNVIADSAVYASVDTDDPSKVIVVAINRTSTAKSAAIQVTHDQRLDLAQIYQLTSASSNPVRAADASIDLVNAFLYDMPAYSVSTMVLTPLGEGDFDGNGFVNSDDLDVWSFYAGTETGAFFRNGDDDRDGDVDGDDLLGWQRALGNQYAYAATAVAAAVPEPRTIACAAAASAVVALRRWRSSM